MKTNLKRYEILLYLVLFLPVTLLLGRPAASHEEKVAAVHDVWFSTSLRYPVGDLLIFNRGEGSTQLWLTLNLTFGLQSYKHKVIMI